MHDAAMTPTYGARSVNGPRLALELLPDARGQARAAVLRRKRDLSVLARWRVGTAALALPALPRLPRALADEARELVAFACGAAFGKTRGAPAARGFAGGSGRRAAAADSYRGIPTAHAAAARYRRHVATLLRELGIDADVLARYRLPLCVEPSVLHHAGVDAYGRALWLEREARAAWQRMRAAAEADGVALQAVSGFRSAEYQTRLLARKLARGQALVDILAVSALPGHSEHHLGTTLDLHDGVGPPLEEAFARTAAYAWLDSNAHRFGFLASYPAGNRFGIAWEPWHWRHHGVPLPQG